jgi:NOL1/NOP2/sun family putative RNA methylase
VALESPFERYRDIIPDYQSFVKALHKPLPTHLRVNLLKIEPYPLIQRLKAKGIPLIEVTEKDPSLFHAPHLKSGGNLLEHVLGYIHFQSLTSSIASILLSPKPGSFALDMCASPGGKTAHLAQIMNNTGLIIANEPDWRRNIPLSHNLARLGVLNTVMTGYQAQEFPLRQKYDFILADVPCSSEGRFRFAGEHAWHGETKQKAKLPVLLRKIILRGFDLLKERGEMVYSTCTYNPEENEGVVDFLLKNRDAELLHAEAMFPFEPGLLSWEKETYDKRLQKAARFYPHRLDSVGFFMARIGRRT